MLHLFRDRRELGVTEVAQAMEMAKGSAYRFLNTFKRLGLIEQDAESGRYRPAVGLLELSSLYVAHLEWQRVVHPLLEELTARSGETTHLAVREGTEVVYVDKIEGNQALRMVTGIGIRRPACCTGTGKALLAALSGDEIRALYEGKELTKFTQYTLTRVDSLLEEIELCRKRGYSVDAEENELGIICVGASIHGQQGKAIAAISVSGPTIRLHGSRIEEIGGMVIETANEASRRLGYRLAKPV